MRSKEEAHDYRYFPDPDLLPLEFDQAYVDALAADLPELPDDIRDRLVAQGLSAYDASIITSDKAVADFLRPRGGRAGTPRRRPTGRSTICSARSTRPGRPITDSPVSAGQLGAIVDLIREGTISGKIAKDVFEIVWEEGGDPREIVEARGMAQVTDTGAIEEAVDKIIAANPDKVAQAREKPSMIGWFVGQVMKETGGKANPKAVNELLRAKISG